MSEICRKGSCQPVYMYHTLKCAAVTAVYHQCYILFYNSHHFGLFKISILSELHVPGHGPSVKRVRGRLGPLGNIRATSKHLVRQHLIDLICKQTAFACQIDLSRLFIITRKAQVRSYQHCSLTATAEGGVNLPSFLW